MTTTAKNRRGIRRHPVSATSGARVEFSWAPCDNQSLALFDITSSGFSFALGESLPGLTNGVEVAGVTLRFVDCDVRGGMVVLHVPAEPTKGMSCGVRFYPASEEERVKLKCVIAVGGADGESEQ